jgi:NADP-dependent 3-hydroxy acid dehydrogenase YdfG
MIAKALEENGAKVFIVGRRKDVLESVAKKEAVRLSSQSRRLLTRSYLVTHITADKEIRNTATSFLSWVTSPQR